MQGSISHKTTSSLTDGSLNIKHVFTSWNKINFAVGILRERSFEQQHYRASGFNLVTAAIVLCNTVYLERATNALRGHGQTVDEAMGQIQFATTVATGLAYDFFRFLKRPLIPFIHL